MMPTIDIKTSLITVFIWIIFLANLVCPVAAHAKDITTGVMLADDSGKTIYEKNGDTPFVPASILKILTSLAAIRILGDQHHFSTDYYFDADTKNLYIKGYGDPLFISEVIQQFCQNIISTHRIDRIHHILIDQTYFSNLIQIPGKSTTLNPYDAPSGALCANFNTIMFKQSPDGGFVSAEPQTPLLPIFYKDIQNTGLTQDRIILTEEQSRLYPGLLIKYFLEQEHISITGKVLLGRFPSSKSIKKSSFVSQFSLEEIIQKLLRYSNNFIANQLLLTLGAKTYQAPATLEKGVNTLKLFAEHTLEFKHINLVEGSGLSKSNQINPGQMIKILIEFLPYHSLLNSQGNEFYKTGTLSGVRTRAGYILGKNKQLYPYVIMINQKNTGYEAIKKDLMNRVSQMIH